MSDNPSKPVPLKPLDVRKIWNNEADDFTPWLADNLDQLSVAVGLQLKLVTKEKRLGAAGRLDILANQAETEAPVVIENQLEGSDNDHFARLLGYAATSESDTVIWIASSFSELHLKVLNWLNRDDGIQFHAVRVQGWNIGEVKGFSLKQVAGPIQGEIESSAATPAWNWTTACAAFYRPLVHRLRSEAGISMIGQGGFRGRYRTFHAGFKDGTVTYAAGLAAGHYGQPDRDRAAVRISGPNYSELYDQLESVREQLAQNDGADEISWPEKSTKHGCTWLGYTKVPSTLQSLKSDPESTRRWMFDRLAKLRDGFQARLAEIHSEVNSAQTEIDVADS